MIASWSVCALSLLTVSPTLSSMDSRVYVTSTSELGRLSVPVISSMLLSIVMLLTVLPSNKPAGIWVRPLPIVTSCTPSVFEKADAPIEVTESGIARCSGNVPT